MTKDNYSVMVVEDEALLLRAVTLKLEKIGLSVVSCTTGKQAISYLSDLPELPSVIWLDYYLGDMTGLDFIQQLKANPLWDKIPVVVVSNSASDSKIQNMLALGVKKYLLKAEYRLEDIVKIINEIVEGDKV